MNPLHAIHRQKLFRAITHHREQLKPHRGTRTDIIRAAAGSMYTGDRAKTLHNLLLDTATGHQTKLAANMPRVLIDTPYDSLRGFAAHYQANMNALLKEIHFLDTLQAIILDAFFSVGICKIHQADSAFVELEQDVWANPGSPYAGRVSFDDWVHDTMTGDFRKVQLAADMYRVDYDSLRDPDLYDQKAVKLIKPSSKMSRSEEDQARFASGQEVDEDEYRPMVDLMDVWLPRERLVVTWACDRNMVGQETDPIAVREWDGAETGPYRLLNLGPVPDNIMPSTPGANLKYLHDIHNSQLRRQNRDAEAQRQNPIYEPDAADDAERIKKARRGEWIQVKRKESVGVLNLGGVDQGSMIYDNMVVNTYDRAAGRGSQAGMGMQADTATQEGYIRGEIQGRDGWLNTRVQNFLELVFGDLGSLLWKDDLHEIAASVEVPGLSQMVPSNWNVDRQREGDFAHYNFTVSPYSYMYRSPEQSASLVRMLVPEIAQAIPIIAQSGGDPQEYVAKLAEYYNEPILRRIFRNQMPMQSAGQQPITNPAQGMANFNKPNGNYHRTNSGSGRAQGNNAMMGMMPGGMNGGRQPAMQGIT